MCLPTPQVDRFYSIWRHLLLFANEELKLFPVLAVKALQDSIDVSRAVAVRNALWQDEAILNKFIAKNPAGLSPEDLQMAESWKFRRVGNFILFKVLKKHAIFISSDSSESVFAVKGLASPFDEIFPYIPKWVKTSLLPFGDDIVTDGLYESYELLFGRGITSSLKEAYDDAKERGEIIKALLPSREARTTRSLISKAEATNAKVLAAFSKHQYKAGRSLKIAERDLSLISRFAQSLLTQTPEPHSLRDFGESELKQFFGQLPESERKSARLSLKRFLSFSRDTGRMDWYQAENLLEILKDLDR